MKPGPVIAKLAAADKHFANDEQWHAHLVKIGLEAPPDATVPLVLNLMHLAAEGVLWGSVKAHGFGPIR